MRVIVACEFSGNVRDAFAARGHDAWSCDLLPTEKPGNHYRADIRDVLGIRGGDRLSSHAGWDLMIAHPPCQYLSRAGVSWLGREPSREDKREAAMAFFMLLWNVPHIPKVCIENPVGYPWQAFRPPDQSIDPFDFGDHARKRTGLWLKNLPRLVTEPGIFQEITTRSVPKPAPIFVDKNGKARHFVDAQPSGSKKRSETFPGIARAMAEQWG